MAITAIAAPQSFIVNNFLDICRLLRRVGRQLRPVRVLPAQHLRRQGLGRNRLAGRPMRRKFINPYNFEPQAQAPVLCKVVMFVIVGKVVSFLVERRLII